MTATATARKTQNLRALDLANARRIEAARQRRTLIGAPAHVLIPALIDPTPELATYKLGTLFGTRSNGSRCLTLIPYVGPYRLRSAIAEAQSLRPNGRQGWDDTIRLGELTRAERTCLVRAVVRRAPSAWRSGQCQPPKQDRRAEGS